jgi:hypothetical protein
MTEPLSLLIFTIDADPPRPDKPSSNSPSVRSVGRASEVDRNDRKYPISGPN